MSCFMCENETITRAVRAMRKDGELVPSEEEDKLGAEMLALNALAYHHRYGGELAQERYERVVGADDCSKIQLLKSLSCLIYQCSEGDIPETSTLYARMKKAEQSLCHEVISNLPEWNQAKWA